MSRMLKVISVLWLLLVSLSFSWNFYEARHQQEQTVLLSARSFFEQVQLTRAWNASHGGVYLPVTPDTQPNPYLNTPQRDLVISDQLTLTRVNPAYMTRQIAELAELKQRNIALHITSLNPIRPENKASDRETEALLSFEQGVTEHSEILERSDGSYYFYMAPLVTKPACLGCHAQQGYKTGDIRGGISVTLPYPKTSSITPLLLGHLLIGSFGFIGILLGSRKLQQAYNTIKIQSDTDFLTSLANRRAFEKRIQQSIFTSARNHGSFALLLLDLDRFKDINDSHGHPVGDKLLKAVSCRLNENLREADTIARLGGDEFAVLLENINDAQDAAQVASKILELFRTPWQIGLTYDVIIGVSIGISLYPANGNSVMQVMQQADSALYRAKHNGRNRFEFFTEDLTCLAIARLKQETKLRKAINNNELEVYFQPILDSDGITISGAEALLRWHDPEQGIIMPDNFIPIAEECGLIGQLGLQVLNKACQEAAGWHREQLPIQDLVINISTYQFHHSNFLSDLASVLEDSGFPAHNLILDITENIIMERELETLQILNKVTELGVRIAIDNFGTGYSSLSQLQQFPIEMLKIDRRFISAMNDQCKIADAVIRMGHALGFKIVAEGIETPEHQQQLQQRGCDFMQGFLFSPPLPADQLRHLLEKSQAETVG